MKKLTIPILIIWLLLPFLLAAKPTSSESAWFYNDGQLQAAGVGRVITLDTFPQQSGDLYILQPDGVFTTSYAGLVTLSGYCNVKNNGTWLILLYVSGQRVFKAISTADKSASFVITFPAAPVHLTFSHNSTIEANGVFCSLLFQKVP